MLYPTTIEVKAIPAKSAANAVLREKLRLSSSGGMVPYDTGSVSAFTILPPMQCAVSGCGCA